MNSHRSTWEETRTGIFPDVALSNTALCFDEASQAFSHINAFEDPHSSPKR